MKIMVAHRHASERFQGAASASAKLVMALTRSARTVLLWSERSGQRRRLSLLEAQELADIGLSWDEALRETRKHFWQP